MIFFMELVLMKMILVVTRISKKSDDIFCEYKSSYSGNGKRKLEIIPYKIGTKEKIESGNIKNVTKLLNVKILNRTNN